MPVTRTTPCLLNFDHLSMTVNISYAPVIVEKLLGGRPHVFTNQTVASITGSFQSFTIEISQLPSLINWFDTGRVLVKIPHFYKVPTVSPGTGTEVRMVSGSSTPQTIQFLSGRSAVKPRTPFHFPHAHFGHFVNGNVVGVPTIGSPAEFSVLICPTVPDFNYTQYEGKLVIEEIPWAVIPRDVTQIAEAIENSN